MLTILLSASRTGTHSPEIAIVAQLAYAKHSQATKWPQLEAIGQLIQLLNSVGVMAMLLDAMVVGLRLTNFGRRIIGGRV